MTGLYSDEDFANMGVDIIIPTSFAFDLSCLHTTDTAGTYWSSYDITELKHNHNPLSAFLCFDLYELTKV